MAKFMEKQMDPVPETDIIEFNGEIIEIPIINFDINDKETAKQMSIIKMFPGWVDVEAVMNAMKAEYNRQKAVRTDKLIAEAQQLYDDTEWSDDKYVGGKMSYKIAYLLNNRDLSEENDTAHGHAKWHKSVKYHEHNCTPQEQYHTRRRKGNRKITREIRRNIGSEWTTVPTKRLDVCLLYGKDDAIFEKEHGDPYEIAEQRLYNLSAGLETDEINLWIYNHDRDDLIEAALYAAKKLFKNVIIHLELGDIFKNCTIEIEKL